jgi:hypothetical protein
MGITTRGLVILGGVDRDLLGDQLSVAQRYVGAFRKSPHCSAASQFSEFLLGEGRNSPLLLPLNSRCDLSYCKTMKLSV